MTTWLAGGGLRWWLAAKSIHLHSLIHSQPLGELVVARGGGYRWWLAAKYIHLYLLTGLTTTWLAAVARSGGSQRWLAAVARDDGYRR